VHKAPVSGELLLRGTADASCEYCHIYTSLGGVVLYGGNADVYYATHDDFSHNRTSDSACTDCHSVHGADTLAGYNSDKILRDWAAPGSGRSYSAEALAIWPDPKSVAGDQEQITAWCTGCHSYYVSTYNTNIQVSSFDHTSTYGFVSSLGMTHVMRSAGAFADPKGSPSVQGAPVAYRDSITCRSCHDAGATDLGAGTHALSFPHSTPGYYQFMKVAESAASPSQENTSGPRDGLCLKCHRDDVSTGIGVGF
jgi:hypothetical protein